MNKLIYIITLMLLCACNSKPRVIAYGKDNCHYCKMTIVDQQHASELVTKKGKIYVYDAIECMLYDLKDHPERDYKYHLVNTYNNPKILKNAHQSIYLISEKLPSPMGANLTAFKDIEQGEIMLQELGGKLYSWDDLKKQFNL